MVGNSKTGRALYTGHARLWQGPSVLEADSIELLRDTRVLNANGNVRAVFPKARERHQERPKEQRKCRLAHLVGNAHLLGRRKSRAPRKKRGRAIGKRAHARSGAGFVFHPRRATAKSGRRRHLQNQPRGRNRRRRGANRATGAAPRSSGVYTADDDKFVLSGGTPTLYDGNEGTTTGRELTFNIADDTIIVDSGNGTRTLTRHRVQR